MTCHWVSVWKKSHGRNHFPVPKPLLLLLQQSWRQASNEQIFEPLAYFSHSQEELPCQILPGQGISWLHIVPPCLVMTYNPGEPNQ